MNRSLFFKIKERLTVTVLCFSDLKRNEYTPDKVTFPQEDPPNPGGGVKESRQSMRLMLWWFLKWLRRIRVMLSWSAFFYCFVFFFFQSQVKAKEQSSTPNQLEHPPPAPTPVCSLKSVHADCVAFVLVPSKCCVKHNSTIIICLFFLLYNWGGKKKKDFNIFCTRLWIYICMYMNWVYGQVQ